MIAVTTRDSKKQRTLSINGFVKTSGTKCAKVTNDHSEIYFVQVRTNGTTTCKQENGEECKGHKFTGHCYHADAVTSADLPAYEQVAAFLLSEVMADADTAMRTYDITMYEDLATTKSVTVVEGCICQGCCKAYRPEHEEQIFCRRCC